MPWLVFEIIYIKKNHPVMSRICLSHLSKILKWIFSNVWLLGVISLTSLLLAVFCRAKIQFKIYSLWQATPLWGYSKFVWLIVHNKFASVLL